MGVKKNDICHCLRQLAFLFDAIGITELAEEKTERDTLKEVAYLTKKIIAKYVRESNGN